MPKVEHRDWGLDSPTDDRHWLLEISCRISDPHWWEVLGHKISPDNRKALDICGTCLHGGLGRGGRCEQAARDTATAAYRTDGVIMAGALWREGVPYIPTRCQRCNRPYLWRWQAGGTPDHRCPPPPPIRPAKPAVAKPAPPRSWNVLAA